MGAPGGGGGDAECDAANKRRVHGESGAGPCVRLCDGESGGRVEQAGTDDAR
jgi:hypothetical protein